VLHRNEQLGRLREQIAAIHFRFAQRNFSATPVQQEAIDIHAGRSRIEEWANGEVVQNRFGEHFQTERRFPGHKQHGSVDIGSLAELPCDLMDALGGGEVPTVPCERWAFLDTETSGLRIGPDTYAFLIGIGQITRAGFRLRQFFMRDYSEEPSLLAAVAEHLRQFDVLITYNGKTYDQPLLETRYRICRHTLPFGRLAHVDLLHGARRIWKLRCESCRLMELERQILGFQREGDLPGEMIPYVYFDYVRSQEACKMAPVFHHNAIDILTLACLTAIVPAAFRHADFEALTRLGLRRGEDLCGIARWLIGAGEKERGLELLKRAVDTGLPDHILFRALWDIGLLEKKLGRTHAAVEVFSELAECRNAYRSGALEELAKYYERAERSFSIALEYTHSVALERSVAAPKDTPGETIRKAAFVSAKIRALEAERGRLLQT
jgi:uncharacterized protein YprB with RNaseH-like and TPR domain